MKIVELLRPWRYRIEPGLPGTVVNVIDLNTEHYTSPGYRDELQRIRCGKCGHLYELEAGPEETPLIEAITRKHLELCEGNSSATLVKLDALLKQGGIEAFRWASGHQPRREDESK